MIKLKSLLLEMMKKIEVPDEPGTVSIPSDHLRLYHYTNISPEIIKREGLLQSKSRGSTYGEPNGVWASLELPQKYKLYAEFSMAIDDRRFTGGGLGPDVSKGAEWYKGRGNDFVIFGDVKPSEIIAIHEPWHHSYRYLVKDKKLIAEVLAGNFDDLLKGNNPTEAKAILAIKTNFGNSH
jgi:hypothetical protein